MCEANDRSLTVAARFVTALWEVRERIRAPAGIVCASA